MAALFKCKFWYQQLWLKNKCLNHNVGPPIGSRTLRPNFKHWICLKWTKWTKYSTLTYILYKQCLPYLPCIISIYQVFRISPILIPQQKQLRNWERNTYCTGSEIKPTVSHASYKICQRSVNIYSISKFRLAVITPSTWNFYLISLNLQIKKYQLLQGLLIRMFDLYLVT